MRTLNIPLDDIDFDRLEAKKGQKKSWRNFILELVQAAKQQGQPPAVLESIKNTTNNNQKKIREVKK